MTISRSFRFTLATATLRADGSLAPTRPVPLGGYGAFRPWTAQRRGRAWVATERFVGPEPGPHQQALLFASR
jgi:hypothetical protein